MTYSVSIATYDELKIGVFPSYIPLYKSIDLASNKYLFEEYLDILTDTYTVYEYNELELIES